MKILIAVDGSDFTPRTLDPAARHRELPGASHDVTLFASVSVIPPHAA